jgi:hypothetical protein
MFYLKVYFYASFHFSSNVLSYVYICICNYHISGNTVTNVPILI